MVIKKVNFYDCSIHGKDGDLECEECRELLQKLADDNKAKLVY